MTDLAYARVMQSAETVERYTPPEISAAAHAVMGGIDLDPASCAKANALVQARAFISPPVDGLEVPWTFEGQATKVFLNPPGGKLSPKTFKPLEKGPGLSSSAVWWWKLLDEYRAGNVEQAIFVCFSLNIFQNAQEYDYPAPYAFPFCVPSSRLRFWNEATPIGKGQPQHPNAVVFLRPKGNEAPGALARFKGAFSPFGEVRL
jgi:hypothetical protein